MPQKSKSQWDFGELFSRAETAARNGKLCGLAVLLICVAAFAACKRESGDNTKPALGIVVFPDAGVSINVGEGWKRIYIRPNLPTCPPTLASSNGVVGAMLFAKQDTMQEAIDAAHSMYAANTNSIKDSWHQLGFTTSSGLAGQHISHLETKTQDGNKTLRQWHDFIVQRKDGRLVSINYVAPVCDNADAVQHMIQSSLKLQ
jgi:hypothetical protein